MKHEEWLPELAAGYNEFMITECSAVTQEILSSQQFRLDLLADCSPLHQRLFSRFVPAGFSEYAGTFRGTPGTVVENRQPRAKSILRPGTDILFLPPTHVQKALSAYYSALKDFLAERDSLSYDCALRIIAFGFAELGRIHPFLDGNGHVQRAAFYALATELGYKVSSKFSIHPRPYDGLMAMALEDYSECAGSHPQLGQQLQSLSCVEEYLNLVLV